MKVLITGATGLIGSAIVEQCKLLGWDVNYLTTNKQKIVREEGYSGFFWNPKDGAIDNACFEGVDAIINLAGASISKRWTKSYKKEILKSRTAGLLLLKKQLNALKSHTVHQLVSASAIGIYPNSLQAYYDADEIETDKSFLGEVTKAWEQAADTFNEENIKVTKLRIGLVLSPNGGALPEIIKPLRLGLGAAFGSGAQWQSWIHIKDLASMFLFVLDQELEGVYNGVAPNPVTNKKLTKEVASVLKKPLFLPNIPEFMMKLILGEMSYILFASQRVSSKGISEEGFQFDYSNIRSALENLLLTERELLERLA